MQSVRKSGINSKEKGEEIEESFFVRMTMMIIFIGMFFAIYGNLISI